jgi:hypothetical protein
MSYTVQMNWAARRQKLVLAILIICAAAIFALVLTATLYKAPSCTDGIQNQGEEGPDCGGPCPYLCSASEVAPTTQFVRAVSPGQGRTDVIAYINNPNTNGGVQGAQYTIELYDSNNAPIAHYTGLVNLPPNTVTPLFVPGVYQGPLKAAQAFLTFDQSTLKYLRTAQQPLQLTPSNIQILNSSNGTPKVTATVSNPTAQTMYGITVVATVFDASNNAVGASQTVVPILPAQGTAPLVFTWNQPFDTAPVRVEILRVSPPSGP